MKFLVAGAGVVLFMAGAYGLVSGYDIVQVERGWASMIAGAVILSAGCMMLGIAALIARIEALALGYSPLGHFPKVSTARAEDVSPAAAAPALGMASAAFGGLAGLGAAARARNEEAFEANKAAPVTPPDLVPPAAQTKVEQPQDKVEVVAEAPAPARPAALRNFTFVFPPPEAPQAETQAPQAETQAPQAETQAPQADIPPQAETEAPQAELNAPQAETEAPQLFAETPEAHEAPDVAVIAPVQVELMASEPISVEPVSADAAPLVSAPFDLFADTPAQPMPEALVPPAVEKPGKLNLSWLRRNRDAAAPVVKERNAPPIAAIEEATAFAASIEQEPRKVSEPDVLADLLHEERPEVSQADPVSLEPVAPEPVAETVPERTTTPDPFSDDWLARALAGTDEPNEPSPSRFVPPSARRAALNDAKMEDELVATTESAVDAQAQALFADDAAEPAPLPAEIGRYTAGDVSYIMYADGSISAETQTGTFRFASLMELKTFIERGA